MGKKICFCILLGILSLLEITGCAPKTADYLVSNGLSEEGTREETPAVEESGSEETEPSWIYVYVCGAVKTPGVYTLQEGARMFELFEAAGGLKEEAAHDYWNQARLLADGEMICVPTREEAAERSDKEKQEAAAVIPESEDRKGTNGKINLNTASKEELMTLPGIGESKALAILSYRDKLGGFSSVEDLKQIAGIKDAVLAKIADFIEIN